MDNDSKLILEFIKETILLSRKSFNDMLLSIDDKIKFDKIISLIKKYNSENCSSEYTHHMSESSKDSSTVISSDASEDAFSDSEDDCDHDYDFKEQKEKHKCELQTTLKLLNNVISNSWYDAEL